MDDYPTRLAAFLAACDRIRPARPIPGFNNPIEDVPEERPVDGREADRRADQYYGGAA